MRHYCSGTVARVVEPLKEMQKSIEFFCWENDQPIEVQLEPEAHVFTVQPGMSLKFEPVNSGEDFQWALRITHLDNGIQLFPDTREPYDGINIYKNGELEVNWTNLYSQ